MTKKLRITTLALLLAMFGMIQGASAGVILKDTWYRFQFGGAGSAATIGIGETVGPPWEFTSAAGDFLTVTDAFLQGDSFDIFDFGVPLFATPTVGTGGDCGSDPIFCLSDPLMSHASLFLSPGAHSFTITVRDSPFGGGAGFLCVGDTDAEVCGLSDTVVGIPEPASLALMSLGLIAVGTITRRRRRT